MSVAWFLSWTTLLLLAVVLASPMGYRGVFEWIGAATPYSALNTAGQYLLIVTTVQTVAFALLVVNSVTRRASVRLISGPVFRMMHGGKPRDVGRHEGTRRYLLSARSLDGLTNLLRASERVHDAGLTWLEPFLRWTSLSTMGVGVLVLIAAKWSDLSAAVTDLIDSDVARYTGANLDLLIAALALIVAVVPYAVLIILLFSRAGRRARLWSASQLNADATQHLAKTAVAMNGVVLAASDARQRLVEARSVRIIRAVGEATGGRIGWYDGIHPFYDESDDLSEPLVWRAQPIDDYEEGQRRIEAAVASVEQLMTRIEAEGLSQVCEAATGPMHWNLLDLDLSFRPGLRDTTESRPGRPSGQLSAFMSMIDRAGAAPIAELKEKLVAELAACGKEGYARKFRSRKASSHTPWRAGRRRHEVVRLSDLDQDDDADDRLIFLLERANDAVKACCESIDRSIVRESVRLDLLHSTRVYIDRYVLGGHLQTVAARLR